MSKHNKWFRIATAGQTTDGREIQSEWIEQMAATYDPSVYGARINVEHIRGWLPDSDFGAYGDVLALKAETVQVNGEDKLALFAQLAANDKLKALNKANQKIYTSVEIDTNFAKTGKAYLVGLAVTDSPASLGTEMLQFAATAQVNPLAHKKQKADNLFAAAVEIELDDNDQTQSLADAIVARIKAIFSESAHETATDAPSDDVTPSDDTATDDTDGEVTESDLTEIADVLAHAVAELHAEQYKALTDKIDTLESRVIELSALLDTTPVPSDRPTAVSASVVVDC